MDNSTMSPEERQFHELLEGTKTMHRAMGRAKGWIDGMGRVVNVQGLQRFGKPSDAILAAFDSIRADDHLQALALRMVDPKVRSWDDLFRGIEPREGLLMMRRRHEVAAASPAAFSMSSDDSPQRRQKSDQRKTYRLAGGVAHETLISSGHARPGIRESFSVLTVTL